MAFRQGDQGAGVGEVQQLLLEAGFTLDPVETAAQKFGISTFFAVRQFQSNHLGSDGHTLAEDGVVGPETLWALKRGSLSTGRFTAPGWRCSPSEARAGIVEVLRWAVGKIGLCEQPPASNRGVWIDRWADACGIPLASPWCAAFASAAYHQHPDGSPFGWLGSTYKLQQWALANRRMVPAVEAEAGDVWGILRDAYHGHTGLVGGRVDGGLLATVEGNAGNAVRGLVRAPASLSFVFRPVLR